MRIAFIGGELFANIPLALHSAGYTITHAWTVGRTSLVTPVTWKTVERRTGLRAQVKIVDRDAIESLHGGGVDLILCGGYPSRLAVHPTDPVPSVNIHPSPLPEGRGPAPIPWAILTGRSSTAVTLHEMVHDFDAGPILARVDVPISPLETSASLDSRCREAAVELVLDTVAHFAERWAARTPQGPASYCHNPTRDARTLDLAGPVEQIGRVLRAFTPGNILVEVGGKPWVVFDAEAWPETHRHRPGSVVARNGATRLLAAADGFVLVRSALPEGLVRLRFAAGNLRRFIR